MPPLPSALMNVSVKNRSYSLHQSCVHFFRLVVKTWLLLLANPPVSLFLPDENQHRGPMKKCKPLLSNFLYVNFLPPMFLIPYRPNHDARQWNRPVQDKHPAIAGTMSHSFLLY